MRNHIVQIFVVCLVTIGAAYFLGASGAAAQQSKSGKTYFMKEDATPDDWVKALKRPPTTALTRGLTPRHEIVQDPAVNALITFEFNSAALTAEAKQQLDGLARALRSPDLWGSKIRLEGHTDASGPEEYNKSLSQLRAEAVRDYLMQRANLDTNMFEPVGKGESELLDKARPTAQINRRVSIVNIGNK